MFDQFQNRNNRPDEPRWIGPRILTGAAAGLLLAAGLCGAGATFERQKEFGGAVSVFGAIVLVISVIALLVGALVFVVELIANARGEQ